MDCFLYHNGLLHERVKFDFQKSYAKNHFLINLTEAIRKMHDECKAS